MTETGKRAENATISDLGIQDATAYWNLSSQKLAEIHLKMVKQHQPLPEL